MPEGSSRKGAKTQSAAAFLRVFLCVFAPLREKCLLAHVKILTLGTFCAKLCGEISVTAEIAEIRRGPQRKPSGKEKEDLRNLPGRARGGNAEKVLLITPN
jgi:hypothetical protein